MSEFSGIDQGYKSYREINPGQKTLAPPVAAAFRPILQQCFSTLWDNTVVVSPDPMLPMPEADVIERVLAAIQHGYDKEWFRIPREPHANRNRLSVDMLEPAVQIALVQSLISLIEQYEQGNFVVSKEPESIYFGSED